MNEPKVYISYAHDDSEWVHKFAAALREHGVQVWLDDWAIRPGDSIAEAIEDGLRSSDVIVSILTPANARHPNVLFDLGVALASGKTLIPIISADIDNSLILSPFRARRAVVKGEPDVAAREVAEALKARAA